MPPRRTDAEKGFTLLQTMLVVAVLGILAALTARLLGGVLRSWIMTRATFEVHQSSRQSRDLLVQALRDASASSVIITRANALQPPLSKLCYIDTRGDSRVVYQDGRRLVLGTWSNSTATVSNTKVLLNDYVERFNAYYPDQKDPTHVAFSLMIRATPLRVQGKTIELLTTGDVEMKAP